MPYSSMLAACIQYTTDVVSAHRRAAPVEGSQRPGRRTDRSAVPWLLIGAPNSAYRALPRTHVRVPLDADLSHKPTPTTTYGPKRRRPVDDRRSALSTTAPQYSHEGAVAVCPPGRPGVVSDVRPGSTSTVPNGTLDLLRIYIVCTCTCTRRVVWGGDWRCSCAVRLCLRGA